MGHRNSDGTFRGGHPTKVTNRTLVARFVETEVTRLKGSGMSFCEISVQITSVGRGEAKATTDPPAELQFPPGFSITSQGCHKAYRRAMRREPALAAQEHRRLDTERCEELYRSLQAGLRRGDPRSIEAAVKVMQHKSRLLGLDAPHKVAVIEDTECPQITLAQFRMLLERGREARKREQQNYVDQDEDECLMPDGSGHPDHE